MYGGGKLNQVVNKPQLHASSNSENKTSKATQLHLAKSMINQIRENRITVESEKSQAEYELLQARKLVKELKLEIHESKTRAEEYRKGAQQPAQAENDQYEEVAREVEVLKGELSRIELEIDCVVGEIFRVEKEADAADLRLESYARTAEKMRIEIEEANEEEVLAELAQIQARKELSEIEAQRKKERDEHLFRIEEYRKKIGVLRNEVGKIKDLEKLLELTNSDVDALQNELNLIKEMDYKIMRSQEMKKNSSLQSIKVDVEAAKKELEVIKKTGIQLMDCMDVIRNELINITRAKSKIEKLEAEKEKSIKKMNLKLLKAKDKLEAARESEEQAKLMLTSFSTTLEKLKGEKEEARKEEEQLKDETKNKRAEIQKINSETERNEKRLEAVLEDLEEVKTVEANALEKLQAVAENVARKRASKTSSTITISKYEYKYLIGCAAGAQEIADKKVAAANAWAEALTVDENEIKMKIVAARRKIEELKLKEEEVHKMEKAENAAKLGTEELQTRRTMKDRDYSLTPVRQTKLRGTSGTRRISTSISCGVKRRKKAMLEAAKYVANDQTENDNFVPLTDN